MQQNPNPNQQIHHNIAQSSQQFNQDVQQAQIKSLQAQILSYQQQQQQQQPQQPPQQQHPTGTHNLYQPPMINPMIDMQQPMVPLVPGQEGHGQADDFIFQEKIAELVILKQKIKQRSRCLKCILHLVMCMIILLIILCIIGLVGVYSVPVDKNGNAFFKNPKWKAPAQSSNSKSSISSSLNSNSPKNSPVSSSISPPGCSKPSPKTSLSSVRFSSPSKSSYVRFSNPSRSSSSPTPSVKPRSPSTIPSSSTTYSGPKKLIKVSSSTLTMAKTMLAVTLVYGLVMLHVLRKLWKAIATAEPAQIDYQLKMYGFVYLSGFGLGWYSNKKFGASTKKSLNIWWSRAIFDLLLNASFIWYTHTLHRMIVELRDNYQCDVQMIKVSMGFVTPVYVF